MAKRKLKKKKTAGKVIMGLSVSLILVGLAAGGMYALDKTQVSASQKQETGGEVSEGTSSVEDLENKVAELEATKTELQNKIASLTAEKTALEATITENEAVIGSLNNQIATLDEEITTLRAEKLALESANETNLEAIAGLNANIETLENERATLQIELDLKEETLSSLQAEVESLRQQVLELSQGNYSLSVDNTNLTRTRVDQNYLGMHFDDVTSLSPTGETTFYETSYQLVEDTPEYEKYIVYHFNGTSENGDYATRYLTVLRHSANVKIQGQDIKNFDIDKLENKTISYEDITISSLSEIFTNINNIEITISNIGVSNDNHYLTETGQSYKFEDGNYYRVWINYQPSSEDNHTYESYEFVISTNTTGVYRINWGENISINSSGMNNDGNYEINFNGNGFENMRLEINGAAIENAINGNWWELEYQGMKVITTDGTEFNVQSAGHGNDNGIENMNTLIYTTNSDINLCLDLSYIFAEYQSWVEDKANNPVSNLGITVSEVSYFENGKGFEDTPKVTSIYQLEEDNPYVVFEFDAFGQVGNKLYLCLGDGQGYVELGDGDRQTAVVSLESNSDNEAIINIGYALPGTQLHITIVPAE